MYKIKINKQYFKKTQLDSIGILIAVFLFLSVVYLGYNTFIRKHILLKDIFSDYISYKYAQFYIFPYEEYAQNIISTYFTVNLISLYCNKTGYKYFENKVNPNYIILYPTLIKGKEPKGYDTKYPNILRCSLNNIYLYNFEKNTQKSSEISLEDVNNNYTGYKDTNISRFYETYSKEINKAFVSGIYTLLKSYGVPDRIQFVFYLDSKNPSGYLLKDTKNNLYILYNKTYSYLFEWNDTLSNQSLKHSWNFNYTNIINITPIISRYNKRGSEMKSFFNTIIKWCYNYSLCKNKFKDAIEHPEKYLDNVYNNTFINKTCYNTYYLNYTGFFDFKTISSLKGLYKSLDIAGIHPWIFYRNLYYNCNINSGWYPKNEYITTFRRYLCDKGECIYNVKVEKNCADYKDTLLCCRCSNGDGKQGYIIKKYAGVVKAKYNFKTKDFTYDWESECKTENDLCPSSSGWSIQTHFDCDKNDYFSTSYDPNSNIFKDGCMVTEAYTEKGDHCEDHSNCPKPRACHSQDASGYIKHIRCFSSKCGCEVTYNDWCHANHDDWCFSQHSHHHDHDSG